MSETKENQKINNKKIDFLIIDGDSFIHRAYHGNKTHNKFMNEKNAAFKGFIKMLKGSIEAYQSPYLAVVLDHQGDTFRKEIYKEYKGNRPPKEADFIKQVNDIHAFVKSSGMPYFCVEGVEGDDVIGVLAKKAESNGMETTILTGDKDIAQIVSDKTRLVDTKSRREINLGNLEEIFGVTKPLQIVDLLSLKGDVADNILGMRDCGEKSALGLIKKYGSISNLLKQDLKDVYDFIRPITRSEDRANSIINQIENEKDKLLLWKYLTTLNLDIDIPLTRKDIKFSKERMNPETFNDLRKKYNFKTEYSIPKPLFDLGLFG